jgi:multicomponent Na+:H+ antiporter subunit B
MNGRQQPGMTLIVKTVTRLTLGLILLFGVYIVLHGHLSPGGGFAGGVIIALSFLHLMLAFGKDLAMKKISRAATAVLESAGALLFVAIALLGYGAGWFFLNFFADKGQPFRLFSAGTIPLCNIAIGLKVGLGLFSVFVALVTLKVIKRDDR